MLSSSFASTICPLRILRKSSAANPIGVPDSSSIGPSCVTIVSFIFVTTLSKCCSSAYLLSDLFKNSIRTSSAFKPAASNIFSCGDLLPQAFFVHLVAFVLLVCTLRLVVASQ